MRRLIAFSLGISVLCFGVVAFGTWGGFGGVAGTGGGAVAWSIPESGNIWKAQMKAVLSHASVKWDMADNIQEVMTAYNLEWPPIEE